jgi:hypothetical protein|tara:strand:+ start:1180 stop:1437 length:258 start_codon:yes stop_codon:yes gene_type:complete
MKIFIYKTIFVAMCLLILYQLTIGRKIADYEHKLRNLTTEQGKELIKNKIRSELKKGIEKDQILKPEDREIIKQFITKIQSELNE